MTQFHGNWDTAQRRNFRRVLVVGGGRAGVAAAEELRRQGFGGEVTIMCDEPDAPYDRPSCSKGLLTGHKRPRDAKMPVQDDLAIHWEMGVQAVHLDAGNRVVFGDNEQRYEYDGLVIATGARPTWPKGWPKGEPGLYALHGIRDAWGLRKALQRAKRVAVVGGGLTGCEVACSVRAMARQCVLIDSKQQVMSRALGEVVGRYVTEEVANDGVELRLGRRTKALERGRRGWILVLDDGSEVEADVVVATIGERPDMRWLASSGLDVSDGVLCDEHLKVVGAEDIVAAGTVARWPNLRYSTKPQRVGQWIMALEQGRAAAASLLGSDHPARPAALIPRFWSQQFGLRIQVCGEVPTDGSAEMTVSRQRPTRRDTARGGVLVGYHRDGEQIGLVGVNAVRAFTTTARMMLAAPPKLVGQAYDGPPMLPPAPPRMARPALPAAEPRMLPPAPAAIGAGEPPQPQYAPAYGPPEYAPAYGSPEYGPAYGSPPYGGPEYGPPPYGEPAYAGHEYGAPMGAPQYAGPPPPAGPLMLTAAPAQLGPPPPDQYGPPEHYGPPPEQYGAAPYGPEGYPPEAYSPEGYPPEGYPPEGYPPEGYGPPPQYEPAGYPAEPYGGYSQYGPPGSATAGYEPVGYGPPQQEYGAPPEEYGPPSYDPVEYAPEYAPQQYGFETYDYGPEQYEQYGPAPVSPPVAPPEYVPPPPPRPSPRDRFATDQFAAVR